MKIRQKIVAMCWQKAFRESSNKGMSLQQIKSFIDLIIHSNVDGIASAATLILHIKISQNLGRPVPAQG
jgi:hypothetical protein